MPDPFLWRIVICLLLAWLICLVVVTVFNWIHFWNEMKKLKALRLEYRDRLKMLDFLKDNRL